MKGRNYKIMYLKYSGFYSLQASSSPHMGNAFTSYSHFITFLTGSKARIFFLQTHSKTPLDIDFCIGYNRFNFKCFFNLIFGTLFLSINIKAFCPSCTICERL